VLVGVVRDTLGAPRQGARVTIDGVEGVEAVTDVAGRFRVGGLPAGTRPVVVRAVGYAPKVVNATLRPGREAELAVVLTQVVRLAGITVRETRRAANHQLLQGIAQRGRFLAMVVDSSAIQASLQLRTAFARVPFTQVGRMGFGVWGLTRADGCPLLAAVDGRLTRWDEVIDLSPDYVLALEVYHRVARVPTEFQGLIAQARAMEMPGAGCGLALVWTRNAR
jgi:hypothetical protein